MRTKLYFTIMLLTGMLCLALTTHAAFELDMPWQQTTTNTYSEDFTSYTYKAYTADTIWDIWQGETRLARRDSINQSSSAIVSDSSGNLLLVWEDYRNGNDDIYAQKTDSQGNRLWAQDVRVNSDTGTASQSSPAIASDSSGNLLLVWRDERNGNPDIYAQKIDSNGSRLWAQDVRVNRDTGTAPQSSPAIASDSSGNLLLVWQDGRNSNPDIYAQKIDSNGSQLWFWDVRVNSDTGTSEQYTPAIASDSSGNFLLVWWDGRNGYGNYDIYAQKISSNGAGRWAQDVRVNSDTGTAFQNFPSIASDSSGNLLLVWYDQRNGGSDIYAQKISSNGSRLWAQDVRVSSDMGTSIEDHPAIASDSSGNLLLVWRDDRNSNPDIYAQKISSNGSRLWAQDVRVSSDMGTSIEDYPAIASDSSGNLLLVWTDDRNRNPDIYTQKIDNNGGRLWAQDMRVNSDKGTTTQDYPAIANDSSGNLLLVWTDDRNGNNDIYTQKIDSQGNRLWARDVRVNSDTGAASQNHPAIASDSSGNLLLVWGDSRNGNYDIYAQKIDSNGNRLWAQDVRVNSDTRPIPQDAPAIASDSSGNLLVVWRDDNFNIYAQKINNNSNRLWSWDVRVSSDTGTSEQSTPAIASDSSGNLLVVWGESRNGTPDIYAQKIDSNGSRLWTQDVRVNSDTVPSDPPAIASDSSGNLLVAWRDDTFNIYAQKISSNGSRLWAQDVHINADTFTSNHFVLAIASDSSGNLLLVWMAIRNGNYDIYAQKTDNNGSRLWAQDVRVNSDTGTAFQGSPAIASDSSGNLLVLWTDSRNGNYDIYAQKINQVGGKGWLADLQVVYPDMFHLPVGTVTSRTVDTLIEPIRQATLMADYQTNGGAVQFYLTNDGGTSWAEVAPGVTHIFTSTGSDLRWRADLTGDSIWRHRTPLIHSLQIEYSTDMPSGDSYEPDDTCAQARPIQINGAAQQHTFHQPDDSDWIWFDGQAGVTYIIQTNNTRPNADTILELYGQCGQLPIDEEDNVFSPGATLSFAAPTNSRYYIRVLQNDGSIYGDDTEYDLSVRAQVPTGAAIIVAGRLKTNDTVQPIIEATADLAYQSLLQGGLSPDNILYLSTAGRTGVDGLPTEANVRDAIQNWARTRVGLGAPLWLYLADHGNIDRFHNEIGEVLTAAELNLWLSNLEATSGVDQINIVIDTCYSGSFIDTYQTGGWGSGEISGQGRIIVSSTSSRWFAYAPPIVTGQPVPIMYFSDGFWNAIGEGQSIWSAFLAGRKTVEAGGQRCGDYDYSCQRPWLDDTGDAWFDGTDGLVAQTQGLSASFGGSGAPYIDWLTVGDVSGEQATIRVQVRDDSSVSRVWARIFAPSFTPPETADGSIPEIDVPEVELVRESGDLFVIAYDGFAETGAYQVVVYAQDDEENVASPRWVLTDDSHVYLPLIIK